VLIEPAARSASVHRCMTRIREELTAGGFQVAVVDPGTATDPVSIASEMERHRDAVASIALVGDPDTGSAELWILDRVGPEAHVRRIPVPNDDPERTPAVLAIRTIEVLRASALKLLVESSRTARPEPPPAEVVAPTPPAEPPGPRRFVLGLETGISAFDSPGGGLGAAALPVARVRLPLGEQLGLRLTLAGLGTRPEVQSPRGNATVGQMLGLIELGWVFRAGRRLQPIATAGAGAMRVAVEGQGVFPYRGVANSGWAAVGDAGGGVLAGFGGQLALAAEVHAMFALPQPQVRFVELESATVGRPALLASLTLVVWL